MMEKRTKYLAVLALLGHEQLSYWPSTVAAGLVILASSFIDQHASCNLVTKVSSELKVPNSAIICIRDFLTQGHFITKYTIQIIIPMSKYLS